MLIYLVEVVLLLFSLNVKADDSSVWWVGGVPKPMKNEDIQLVDEKVVFSEVTGKVSTELNFFNHGDRDITLDLGFPLRDSALAEHFDTNEIVEVLKKRYCQMHDFKTQVNGKVLDQVTCIADPNSATVYFVFKFTFKKKQKTVINHLYRFQMSRRSGDGSEQWEYILYTGGLWKGNIEKALFKWEFKERRGGKANLALGNENVPLKFERRSGINVYSAILKNIKPKNDLVLTKYRGMTYELLQGCLPVGKNTNVLDCESVSGLLIGELPQRSKVFISGFCDENKQWINALTSIDKKDVCQSPEKEIGQRAFYSCIHVSNFKSAEKASPEEKFALAILTNDKKTLSDFSILKSLKGPLPLSWARALEYTYRMGNEALADELLKLKLVSPDCVFNERSGDSCLHFAAFPYAVEVMMEQGMPINLEYRLDKSLEFADLLLKNGANPKIKNKAGISPIEIDQKLEPQMLQMLIKYGATSKD
jgi:hypothetical protein